MNLKWLDFVNALPQIEQLKCFPKGDFSFIVIHDSSSSYVCFVFHGENRTNITIFLICCSQLRTNRTASDPKLKENCQKRVLHFFCLSLFGWVNNWTYNTAFKPGLFTGHASGYHNPKVVLKRGILGDLGRKGWKFRHSQVPNTRHGSIKFNTAQKQHKFSW